MKNWRSKRMAPDQARTFKQVCALRTSGADTEHGWILVDVDAVTICQQEAGKEKVGWATLPRKEFARLARWYFRPQTVRSKRK